VAEWKTRDPIARLVKQLTTAGQVSEEEIHEVERLARQRVDEAAQFALTSPWPDPSDVTTHVYG
jgi:pyruvate dehydrogenase E1 component alpha subunit